MTRRRIVLGTLVLLAVGAVFASIRSYHETALQKYVAELRARGEKLTVPELTAGYSASASEWITAFTNQVAALGHAPADPAKMELADFAAPNLARVTWSLSEPPWASDDATQTNVSWSSLNRRLSTARPALRQLQELLRRPAPNGGRPTNWFDFRPVWQEMRSAAGWLACDTLVNLREGRKADALASLLAVAGLVSMHREDCTLVQQMSRVAVADVGLALTWEALQAGGWSEEQLSGLQQSWEEQELIAAMELGLQGEQTLPLESLSLIREHQKRKGGSTGFIKPTWPFNQAGSSFFRSMVLPNDALYGLRFIHHEVELVRQLRDGRPYREVIVDFREHEATLATKAKSVTRILYPITLIGIPAYEKAVKRGAQVEVKRRLAITALALHRYQLSHGHWPQDLTALFPEYLRSVPRDCMDGQPLKYRVNEDGTFILYSVGVDGIDQGGDPKPMRPGLTGLGEGRDAVWPSSRRPARVRPRSNTSL